MFPNLIINSVDVSGIGRGHCSHKEVRVRSNQGLTSQAVRETRSEGNPQIALWAADRLPEDSSLTAWSCGDVAVWKNLACIKHTKRTVSANETLSEKHDVRPSLTGAVFARLCC